MAPPPDNVNFIHPPSLNKAGLSGAPGNKGALRGALCMSLRSKLGVSQAWGTPKPWVSHGLPMKKNVLDRITCYLCKIISLFPL